MRPLHVLVPLIKDDLAQGSQAAQQAGMPYYQAAGQKMLEAKGQLERGQFTPWLNRNFKITERQAREYMNLAAATADIENGSALPFRSLRETVHRTRSNPNYGKPASWRSDVKPDIERARREAQRVREEQLSRQQEREEEKKLALRLIDIGFKVLSKELHPDRGGSRDAMARLNKVRNRLRENT